MIARLLIWSLLVSCTSSLFAQDIHFSMADMSPLTLNPANTGMFEGDWRFASNYRNQWKAIGQPLETLAASYDAQIHSLPKNFSAGIVFVGDRSGGLNLLVSKILLSVGSKFKFNSNTISIGLQGGYVMKRYSILGMTLPGQFNMDTGQFDSSLPSGEDGLTERLGYLDINLGAVYQRTIDKGLITFGASAFHVNMPNESFFGRRNRLPIRPLIHASLEYEIKPQWFIRPSVISMFHSKAQEILAVTHIGYRPISNADNIQAIYMGVEMRTGVNRNGDAFVVLAGMDFNKVKVAISYDVNYSGLQAATNNRGAVEMSLIFVSPSSKPAQLTLPCDRY